MRDDIGSIRARCLDPHDLVAKLAAGRPKDFDFTTALLRADLIDARVLIERGQKTDRVARLLRLEGEPVEIAV